MKNKNTRFSNDIQIRNKKASYEYEFLEKFETGIVLEGAEVKSIREGKVSLQEGYCFIKNNQVYIKGMRISPYLNTSFNILEPTRERKLLLHSREISKLKEKSEEQGLTLVPTKLYMIKRGLVKVEIALAKGKKLYDKRENIKKKDQDRELKRLKLI
ncbi:MAG: SsrA-binding protein [Cyclobacteriaceae bacterium]|jgi:SsrA-binding protein